MISVVLTGGGTGGHIYPAVAVAQVLKNDPEIKALYYIGCADNIEKDIVAREGIDFYSVKVSGMPRKVGLKFLIWLLELIIAIFKAVYILLKLKPDVVFGTGGYVTAPVLLASRILRIPYIIHDPDAHPGMVNRLMAGDAKTVSVAFEQAKNYIKFNNIKVFGNPIRLSLSNMSREDALKALGLSPDKITVLVMGGSQGAKTINDAIRDAVPELTKNGFQVIHQTGKKNYEEYMENFSGEYEEYIVRPYFEDMSVPLNAADIAISRAGSLSISELNLCGLPSILIPYPYAAADHQRFNARAMESAGASVYLEDADCTGEKLIELINEVCRNAEKMKQANLTLAKPDAVENIVSEIKSIIV
ncbi:MAG: undecaprenyldiphospho-muramoylpentapeptide beta-N-acetylglucosaminyltransferase [Candidatus Melainabacteria bacterium GWF2_37_15]|nr:MAG: undecaprenyldiphospho-muramoylpentapeptide beta-N-acetylglucosaminyltransferase [Candidatus Melainabacteria bacterium GWF2_37_15]